MRVALTAFCYPSSGGLLTEPGGRTAPGDHWGKWGKREKSAEGRRGAEHHCGRSGVEVADRCYCEVGRQGAVLGGYCCNGEIRGRQRRGTGVEGWSEGGWWGEGDPLGRRRPLLH